MPMFSADKYVFDFIGGNWMSLYILLTFLKGIAIITPGTTDNKIVTLLSNLLKTAKGGEVTEEDFASLGEDKDGK